MSTVERFCHYIDMANEWTCRVVAYMVLTLTLTVTFEVIMRYVFSKPQAWTWETNLMLFGTIGILGGGYVLLLRRHIRVDVLLGFLSTEKRNIAELLTYVFLFIGCSALMWKLLKFVWDSILVREVTTGSWVVPIYPFKTVLLLGVVLMLLQGVANSIREIAFIVHSKQLRGG